MIVFILLYAFLLLIAYTGSSWKVDSNSLRFTGFSCTLHAPDYLGALWLPGTHLEAIKNCYTYIQFH